MKKLIFQAPKKITTLILQMILKSFKIFFGLLIILLFNLPLQSEDKIDIWKNKDKKEISLKEKNLSEKKKY